MVMLLVDGRNWEREGVGIGEGEIVSFVRKQGGQFWPLGPQAWIAFSGGLRIPSLGHLGVSGRAREREERERDNSTTWHRPKAT